MINLIHEKFIYPARIRNLSAELGKHLPNSCSLLDVGCGDGLLATNLLHKRQLTRVEGVDVLIRPNIVMPVLHFNGIDLPYPDHAWDYVMAVDVLHHAENQQALLNEMLRVAARGVLIKDHLCESLFDFWLLRQMDNVGNFRHGVAVPGKYLSKEQWLRMFAASNSATHFFSADLKLYPWPLSLVFGGALHCVFMLHSNSSDLGQSNTDSIISNL